MQKQFQKVVVLLLVFQAFTTCLAAQTSVGQMSSQLENVALEEMKAAGIPGAAIGIVSRGQVLFVKGFGVTSVDDGFPVTPTTLFRLGSTTKMFTAAALVQMALDGKLNLKRPIHDYVKGLDPAIAAVTTDQLLAHLSGLRNDDVTGNTSDEAALGREVKSWGPSRLFTAPGEVFSYSNDGYWLAGYIAESIAGQPYATVMQQQVFEPLGMTRSTFRMTAAITYPVAQGHRVAGGKLAVVRPMPDNPASWPAGSMFSTVDDLCRWLLAFMNDGQLEGKQVLRKGMVEELKAPHATVPAAKSQYGYGLSIFEFRGVKGLGHGGSRAGYGSFIRIFPEHQLAVVVLTNRQGGQLPKTVEKACELLLPLKPPHNENPPKAEEMSLAEMQAYVGIYKNGAAERAETIMKDGKVIVRDNSPGVEIVIRDGKLFLRSGQNELPITKIGARRFMVQAPGTDRPDEFVMLTDRGGKITYLQIGDAAWKRQE